MHVSADWMKIATTPVLSVAVSSLVIARAITKLPGHGRARNSLRLAYPYDLKLKGDQLSFGALGETEGLIVIVVVGPNLLGVSLWLYFIERLKQRHPSIWVQLGEPELVARETAPKSHTLFDYVVLGKFSRLCDSPLTWVGRVLQILMLLTAGLLLTLGVILILK
jgi:hypothetical protein